MVLIDRGGELKYLLLAITIIIFSFSLNSSQIEIKQVGVIEETEDNSLYGVSGITVSEGRYIFVSNSKENTISKYSWDGKYIKKTGQKGGGPGDFNTPWDIDYYKGYLYVNDVRNIRIVVMDKNLEIKKIIKSQYSVMPRMNLHVTRNLTFVGSARPYIKDKDHNLIKIINGNGELIKSFFNEVPYWSDIKNKSIEYYVALSGNSNLCINLNQNRDKLVVTQEKPNNPAVFYIYTSDGKYLSEFKYELEKGYSFPKPKIIRPTDDSFPRYNPTFRFVFFIGKNILAYMYNTIKVQDDWDVERKLIIFNQKGNVLYEKKISKGLFGLKMYMTSDNHLLSYTIDEDENYMIKIYKLTL